MSMRVLVGTACCVIASACASLPGTPQNLPCAIGEDVVVSNQSNDWMAVYAAPRMEKHASLGSQGVTQLARLAPGEEGIYSVGSDSRLAVQPIYQQMRVAGQRDALYPSDVFISCLPPVD